MDTDPGRYDSRKMVRLWVLVGIWEKAGDGVSGFDPVREKDPGSPGHGRICTGTALGGGGCCGGSGIFAWVLEDVGKMEGTAVK